MPNHLILQLDSPLMAFGDTMIDARGPTRDLPNVSMITGLIANALGWTHAMGAAHQRLQDRIVMGARLDRPGVEVRDFQTAQLAASDDGWTTHGMVEKRRGGANTYKSPHIRERFYRADAHVTIALRLDPADEAPTLEAVVAALDAPARPLFIGRKPCLPSSSLSLGTVAANSVVEALQHVPLSQDVPARSASVALLVPPSELNSVAPYRSVQLTDRRDWISGVHTGESTLHRFALPRSSFAVRTQDDNKQQMESPS